LKLLAPDEKMRETDAANTEAIFWIIQSIPFFQSRTPYVSTAVEELSPYTNSLHNRLDALPKGFPNLPENLKK
jgi:hypothetical protein